MRCSTKQAWYICEQFSADSTLLQCNIRTTGFAGCPSWRPFFGLKRHSKKFYRTCLKSGQTRQNFSCYEQELVDEGPSVVGYHEDAQHRDEGSRLWFVALVLNWGQNWVSDLA